MLKYLNKKILIFQKVFFINLKKRLNLSNNLKYKSQKILKEMILKLILIKILILKFLINLKKNKKW